jgi:transcriptional regulator with XRE-family HTH domain
MSVQHNSDVLYRHVVQRVRGALTVAEIARLTDVGERQVYRWEKGESRPEGDSRSKLLEINYVVQQLLEIYNEEGADIWLHGRNRALGGQRPIEMLEDGQFAPILELLAQINEGVM